MSFIDLANRLKIGMYLLNIVTNRYIQALGRCMCPVSLSTNFLSSLCNELLSHFLCDRDEPDNFVAQ